MKGYGMKKVVRVLSAACLLFVGLAGRGDAATRYAWLDGARLFVVSSDEEMLTHVYPGWEECGVAGGKLAGIFVLDYDVVPPWNGSVLLGTFPAWPRPSRSGEFFRLDDVGISEGTGNLLERDVFLYEWLKKKPREWTPGPWLLRSKVDGWESANLLKTLLALPEGLEVESIGRVRYKGEWIALQGLEGEVAPWKWASLSFRGLPAEVSGNGARPAIGSAAGSPPRPATFYPRGFGYAEAAIREHPARVEGYALRAELEGTMNDEAALRDWNEAIRLAPEIPMLYLGRAEVFSRNRMVLDAYYDAKRAAELDPQWNGAKEYYMRAGNIVEGEENDMGTGP